MALTKVQDALDGWINQAGLRLFFAAGTNASSIAFKGSCTFVNSTGFGTSIPASGAYGTTGIANGRVLTNTTAGALPLVSAVSGQQWNMSGMHATLGQIGTVILVDKIADCTIASNGTAGTITGLDATSRLATGEGAQIWIEWASAAGEASTWTFTYTNNAAAGSQSTGSIVMAASARGGSVTANLWQPLAAGDWGARSIDSCTKNSGGATGMTFCISLVKPLAYIPVYIASTTMERDLVLQSPVCRKIYDASCLTFIFVASTGTQNMNAQVQLVCA